MNKRQILDTLLNRPKDLLSTKKQTLKIKYGPELEGKEKEEYVKLYKEDYKGWCKKWGAEYSPFDKVKLIGYGVED